MGYGSQAIEHPFGINVFGSSLIRVEPDIASVKFAVARVEQKPKEAFHAAHEGAKSVRSFLDQFKVDESSFSRVNLSQEFRYTGSESRFVGYRAVINFHALLRDFDQLEELLIGIVDAGANQIHAVDFQTSKLKELRAEVRRRAVEAAREKAENYCAAANVTLGPVVHIEDVNPDMLGERYRGHGSHDAGEPTLDESEPIRAFDPGMIVVNGAVRMAFELGR